MGKDTQRGFINETTHRRTHNILHIKCVTGCCIKCSKREKQNYYRIAEYNGKADIKYPSWKLVSKNKKQWMKKPLKFKITKYTSRNYTYQEIIW